MDNLKTLIEKENIKLKDESFEKFEIYRKLILTWNEKINLTRILDENEMNVKHFLDCLLLTKTSLFEDCKKVLDIGTGAGFPSIPLKIYNENLDITMLDSLNKRIKFLNLVIDDLNFKKINALHARAEEFALKEDYREKFDLVVSRAVASLPTLLELSIPFLKKDNFFIAMKGPQLQQEIEISKNALKKLSCKVEKILKFEIKINNESLERNILIIKKLENTNKKYPRNVGQIKKKPL